MRRFLLPVLGLVLIAFSLPLPASHAADTVQRPRILGVAHMALYATDIGLSRRFYEGLLGYAESHTLKRPDGSDRIVFIKINDDQFIELVTELPKDAQNEGHLHHIGFYTDSAEALRRYLASRQVAVPETVAKTQNGNLILNFKDPDGHGIEIVQYEPNSRTRQNKGKYLPDTRISTHIYHVGVTIGPLERAMDFYHGILGFNEFWRGSSSGKVLSWVNMRVPDGDDYLEFMLGSAPSDAKQLGVKNHICLLVPNLDDAVAKLQTRVTAASYTQPIQIRTGVNGKRQANLFDPDGTRVELMEPQTASGKPVPSSTAPPPQ